jgi:choline dehydrogenase-like flavoprotein
MQSDHFSVDTQPKLNRRSFLAGLGGTIGALSVRGFTSNSQAADQVPNSKHRTGRFGDVDENTTFDVCIIGSGFAGAILGQSLVRQGIKTVILESGADPRRKSVDPRFSELEVFRSSGPIEYPVVSTRFRGVGGTSWLWAGNCRRFHPMELERNSYAPGGGSWPITYADLEPYFEKAEKALRVRGGKESEYHPPRRVDYPLPPHCDVSPLQSLLKKAGVTISYLPNSTSVNHNPSIFSGQIGPPVRMTESYLPSFQASPYGTLIPEVTASCLLVDKRGRIRGVEVRNLDRDVKVLRARVYVVACGGLESPRLLLLSRSPTFPDGIGNTYGWVGRCFMEHREILYRARVKVDWSNFSIFDLQGVSYQFYKNFKEQGLGLVGLNFALERAVAKQDIYAGAFRRVVNQILRRGLRILLTAEMKPCPENRVTLDKKVKDYFGNPVTNLFLSESENDVRTVDHAKKIVRKIYTDLGAEQVEESPRAFGAHHHMGTCRMGDNPRTSVVDRNLRVHGTTNVFVAGSSVFVTSGYADPTINLTALTLRLADHLLLKLQNGAFPAPDQMQKENRAATG